MSPFIKCVWVHLWVPLHDSRMVMFLLTWAFDLMSSVLYLPLPSLGCLWLGLCPMSIGVKITVDYSRAFSEFNTCLQEAMTLSPRTCVLRSIQIILTVKLLNANQSANMNQRTSIVGHGGRDTKRRLDISL